MARPARAFGAMVLIACVGVAFLSRDGATPRLLAQAGETVESAATAAAPTAPTSYGGLRASDPLERAHAVAALGDARVLAQLSHQPEPGSVATGTGGSTDGSADGRTARALAAIRGASWMAEPQRALPALVDFMQGRDPDLAPAAAQAAVEIARGLVEAAQLPEGVRADELRALAKKVGAIEQAPRVRADIRLAAVEIAALLSAAVERL